MRKVLIKRKVLIWIKSAYYEKWRISTFSLGQKGCACYGKTAYNECAYYELAQFYNRF